MSEQLLIDSFRGPYRFLSNFYVSPFIWLGCEWPSVEHPFQAAKDPEGLRKRSRQWAELSPGQAKRAGRRLPLRPDWEWIRVGLMKQLVFSKFSSDRELLDQLLELRGYTLIEGNSWGDRFWGVCDGVGENHLGRILMQTRDQLGRLEHGWQL